MSISINISSPGAIPNLTALKAAIGDWLDRGNTLDDKIPTFIQMAEAQFNRELRTPKMEKKAIASVASEEASLPDDYLAMRAIYEQASPDLPLKSIPPTADRVNYDGTAGIPVAYSIVSRSIRLIPPPNGTITLVMDYFAKIEPLSTFVPSNWLLEDHPDAYLYGALFQAEAFLDNSTRAQQWKALLDGVVERINRTSRNDRFGAGPLVPTSVAQVRGAKC